jgi:hypothetical protein
VISAFERIDPAKGKVTLQLSRELGVQCKTAWVLLMKLLEVVASCRDDKLGRFAGVHASGLRFRSPVTCSLFRTWRPWCSARAALAATAHPVARALSDGGS